ncbi:DUF7535 family protein [Haloferax sulfurifontis]|uniref:Uncharacterized protein n=2 Tax=Haloferax sulfurifontis TaxID=255616 RepID=M0I0Y4_9EURY|nr:hypothetical protein [Haloferax sulfurifontis]ELZ89034.1 hypothetical protein C441_16094 [Haloferax sulfurifontis ATCC BAA-897]GGC48395.1 hypothetical protein GCM10007209_07530 [Haloferax sulfurifontis]
MARAVNPVRTDYSNTQMGLMGTLIVALIAVLMIPFAPFILLGLVWRAIH